MINTGRLTPFVTREAMEETFVYCEDEDIIRLGIIVGHELHKRNITPNTEKVAMLLLEIYADEFGGTA